MSFSDEVYQRLDVAANAIGVSAGHIQRNPAFPKLLSEWFGLIWHIARATVPLLEFARSELVRHPTDEFLALLDAHFARHINEERNHGDWLLEDMQHLGVSHKMMESQLPPQAISAMVGSQYYLVQHYHPAVILGYS